MPSGRPCVRCVRCITHPIQSNQPTRARCPNRTAQPRAFCNRRQPAGPGFTIADRGISKNRVAMPSQRGGASQSQNIATQPTSTRSPHVVPLIARDLTGDVALSQQFGVQKLSFRSCASEDAQMQPASPLHGSQQQGRRSDRIELQSAPERGEMAIRYRSASPDWWPQTERQAASRCECIGTSSASGSRGRTRFAKRHCRRRRRERRQ